MSLIAYEAQQQIDERYKLMSPVRAVVASTAPEKDILLAQVYGEVGAVPMAIRHPFMGVNSYIRCMPEPGTPMMTQMAGTPKQMEIFGYITRKGGAQLTASETKDATIFRRLEEGAIEVMSSGRAYTHWGTDGNLEQLGGVVQQVLSQSALEHQGRAPTFRRQLDLHIPSSLAHEERFGLVKRPDPQRPNSAEQYFKDANGKLYQEYGRWVNDVDRNILATHQEGHVLDLSGAVMKHSKTTKPLRYRRLVHHKTSGEFITEVDDELNVAVSNSATGAQQQADFNLGAMTATTVKSKKLKLSITESGNFVFGQTFTIQSPQISLVGNVSLGGAFGAATSEPAVKGITLATNLLQPALTTIATAFNVAGADPAWVVAPTAFATAGAALQSLIGVIPNILSTKAMIG